MLVCLFWLSPHPYSSPPHSASRLAGPPPPQLLQDDAEQQAALLLACSGDSLLAPLPPISMFDLLEALQVRESQPQSALPSHIPITKNILTFELICFFNRIQQTFLSNQKESWKGICHCMWKKSQLKWLLLMFFLDVGPPRCDALSHHVCPEHGTDPVPAVASQSRGAGAGPCAPPTPRREGRPACQLRHTQTVRWTRRQVVVG